MCRYQFSPHVYLECFDEDAVLLIADHDYMITINRAGAELYEQAQEAIGNGAFNRSDCIAFLLQHYELTEDEAEQKMRSIIGFGLAQHIISRQP